MDDSELKQELKDTAGEFMLASQEGLKLANERTFEFARLLIQIAFASIGLVAVRITGSKPYELISSRWGLVFLCFSIIAGGIQVLIDREFFQKIVN